jgi:hypothetical protein
MLISEFKEEFLKLNTVKKAFSVCQMDTDIKDGSAEERYTNEQYNAFLDLFSWCQVELKKSLDTLVTNRSNGNG